jgi:hypothetical protein
MHRDKLSTTDASRAKFYVAEFDFRWNARKVDDGERLARVVRSAEGKRLRYREPVAKMPGGPVQGRL